MPLCSLFPSGTQSHLSLMCSLTSSRACTVASNDDAVVQSHTHNTVSLHMRVVGDQDAIHVLIRIRHRSQSSRSTQLSVVFDESWNSPMMFSSTLTAVPIFWTFFRLVGLAPSRAFVRGLALCLLHSGAPPSRTPSRPLALDPVDSRRLLGLCHLVSHGPDSSWDCLSSRAPLDSTKRARSTRSTWSWLAFITMCSILRVLQRGHFSSYERCSSRNTLFSCLQLGSFALRQERVLVPSGVSLSSNNKTSSLRPQS